MDTVTCKTCHRTSTVTSHPVRCLGCQRIISVGNNTQESSVVSSGKNKWPTNQDNHDNISSTSTKRKGLRILAKKLDNIYPSPRSSLSFSQCPTASMSEAPPRGKRALLCGVSYKNRKFKLKGTMQDVTNMANLLIDKFNFPTNAILVLAEYMSYEPPSKNNILRALEWLVKDIKSGDSLVFYFSGHGLRQPEFEGDELDGFDEAICPLDFETAGLIIDNDINKLIVRPLKKDIMLHAIIDACHSGTVLDLTHVYDRNNGRWKDNYPPSGALKGTDGGQAICFSACEDHEEATDTSALSPEKTMSGAMTYTFIKSIMEKQEISYRGILDSMHNVIEEVNISQRKFRLLNWVFHRKMLRDPLLSSSKEFDVNKLFKL
ncbi:hypothetical protein ACH5RR_002024 [Cinchona calisaya]|uniref:Peptidase C14 caspase domain-containing protein n=1 Tax=Cinchona calisaya TaxID=153742 RepID=A0ABD3B555_9GENT